MTKLVDDWRAYILIPVLEEMQVCGDLVNLQGFNSQAAENLLIGIALAESDMAALVQYGGGPALGFMQMEPLTFAAIRQYLNRKLKLFDIARVVARSDLADPKDLIWNLKLQVVMARFHLWRFSKPLPAADDLEALGLYWKQYYNTPAGAGDPAEFTRRLDNYLRG